MGSEMDRVLGDRVRPWIQPAHAAGGRLLREPDPAVRSNGGPVRPGAGRGSRVLADQLAGAGVKLADRAGAVLGEVEVPVGSGHDCGGVGAGRQRRAGARILGYRPVGSDPSELVRVALGEPHGAVRPLGDPVRGRAARDPC